MPSAGSRCWPEAAGDCTGFCSHSSWRSSLPHPTPGSCWSRSFAEGGDTWACSALQLPGCGLSRRTLIRVELIQADKTDVGALGGLQFTVEARTGITGQLRIPGVESFDREQILRSAQALDVAQVHNPVPL